MTFAAEIKKLRQERGWTPEELGGKAHYRVIAAVEESKVIPTAEALTQIALALDQDSATVTRWSQELNTLRQKIAEASARS